jgi:hypothetical protein
MARDEKVRLDAEVKISVNEFKWNGKLSDVVRIDLDALTAELARQPELVSWFGVAVVEATDKFEKCKNELADMKEDQDRIYAECDIDVREKHRADPKPPTEPTVKSLVLTHEKYKTHMAAMSKKRGEMQEAALLLGRISKILIGMEHKRDMLIQLSANYRKEHSAGDYGHDGTH